MYPAQGRHIESHCTRSADIPDQATSDDPDGEKNDESSSSVKLPSSTCAEINRSESHEEENVEGTLCQYATPPSLSEDNAPDTIEEQGNVFELEKDHDKENDLNLLPSESPNEPKINSTFTTEKTLDQSNLNSTFTVAEVDRKSNPDIDDEDENLCKGNDIPEEVKDESAMDKSYDINIDMHAREVTQDNSHLPATMEPPTAVTTDNKSGEVPTTSEFIPESHYTNDRNETNSTFTVLQSPDVNNMRNMRYSDVSEKTTDDMIRDDDVTGKELNRKDITEDGNVNITTSMDTKEDVRRKGRKKKVSLPEQNTFEHEASLEDKGPSVNQNNNDCNKTKTKRKNTNLQCVTDTDAENRENTNVFDDNSQNVSQTELLTDELVTDVKPKGGRKPKKKIANLDTELKQLQDTCENKKSSKSLKAPVSKRKKKTSIVSEDMTDGLTGMSGQNSGLDGNRVENKDTSEENPLDINKMPIEDKKAKPRRGRKPKNYPTNIASQEQKELDVTHDEEKSNKSSKAPVKKRQKKVSDVLDDVHKLELLKANVDKSVLEYGENATKTKNKRSKANVSTKTVEKPNKNKRSKANVSTKTVEKPNKNKRSKANASTKTVEKPNKENDNQEAPQVDTVVDEKDSSNTKSTHERSKGKGSKKVLTNKTTENTMEEKTTEAATEGKPTRSRRAAAKAATSKISETAYSELTPKPKKRGRPRKK